MSRLRIGFDIGGTFTDFVLYDTEWHSLELHKRLTTPHDPSVAALAGIEEIVERAGVGLADIGEIVHGTTLVTNAVIERKGAKLGLLTTEGFRDVLEAGTEQRYDIYDLFIPFPDPLVARRDRLEVPERIDADGEVVVPLDLDAARARLHEFSCSGVEAVAICFLHSYRNPEHERQIGELARREFPDLAISLSSDVVAELWEYQRAVTTCANAYVQPLMDRYLGRLENALAERGFAGALRLMHSAGGLIAPSTAREFPIRLLESGPAGGGLATALFGRSADKLDVISFDMGGTTAKACMIEDGRAEIAPMMEAARVDRFKKGSGLPIKAPVIDMIEIGAGGGSIASIDEVGLLRVGPRSAGSDPGPACYGKGGAEPTVTDANLLLGYYDPEFFLGGQMALDKAAAEEAVSAVAGPLGLAPEDAAWGVHKVVVESMAGAARVHLVEKGKDPRRHAMVGFGGAGPAHAVGVARALGVREVIVPPASGAASAVGFLAAPLSFEQVRSMPVRMVDGFDAASVNAVLGDLEEQGRAKLAEAGVPDGVVRVERTADMRLIGQLHEISVPLPDGVIDAGSLGRIRDAFADTYKARYTSLYEGAEIEAISFRVTSFGPTPSVSLTSSAAAAESVRSKKGTRNAYFNSGWVEVDVHDRYALVAGDRIDGPAIIEERESTTVIPPGDSVLVDPALNLRIDVAAPEEASAVVTADTPHEEAVKVIEGDPIALEIMWSRLVNVVEEMWETVCRTAFSLVVSEAQDFACELLDPTGETLAHSPRAMPVFNLTLPRAVKALLAKYPPETLQPGDVLITNDPWLCAGHLFDIALVTPVFHEGRLIGLMGTVGHVADIGGTKDYLHPREIFEEGLQIPPMKLYSAGEPDESLFTLLGENVRNPSQVIGDIHSFVAANALGSTRLLSFVREYGMHDLRALASVVTKRSEDAMRAAIRELPDGVYTSEIENNPLGEVMRYPVKVTVDGDAIAIDFDGAPEQLPQGGINCTMNYTAAHATYPLKCMLTPNVRGNAGCYRPFEVSAPEGSILNANRPASVNLRTRTGWYIAPNLFKALAKAAPEEVQSFTGLPLAATIYGADANGDTYSDMFFVGGGQGASSKADGKSGLLYPTSAANTSIELFETRVPVLILEKTFVEDSGGAGEHRGGLGTRFALRKRHDDGLPMHVSVYPEGVKSTTPGLFGGLAGSGARGVVRDPSGSILHDCGSGELVQISSTEEIIEIQVSGGAGYGDPSDRCRNDVERDLSEGIISEESRLSDYRLAEED